MPRLGELLVAAGIVAPAALDEGLRAQVIHGARLGTNLVELGQVGLDDLATALARQLRMPPALRRHFERCNPAMQARLPSHVAARHSVVPIGALADNASKVLVAAMGPIAPAARTEIELAMGLPPGSIVFAVAAELRVLYFLERVYSVPRSNRFLRVRRGPSEDGTGRFTPVPPSTDIEVDVDEQDFAPGDDQTTASRPRAAAIPFEPPDDFHIEQTPVDHIIDPPPAGTSWRRPRELEPVPAPDELVPALIDRPLELGGEELRRFVETLADPGTALARVAIRRANHTATSGEVQEAAAIASVLAPDATIEDVARAIRRAQTRNRVGELAIGALRRFAQSELDAAILFVVREGVAIGWKGFSHACDDLAVDELAVPLDAPSVIAASVAQRRALLIEGAHGTPIDRRLFEALGQGKPGEVAVAPILLADHAIALLYGQVATGARMARLAELFAAVQQATTSAFARLMRAAQR